MGAGASYEEVREYQYMCMRCIDKVWCKALYAIVRSSGLHLYGHCQRVGAKVGLNLAANSLGHGPHILRSTHDPYEIYSNKILPPFTSGSQSCENR